MFDDNWNGEYNTWGVHYCKKTTNIAKMSAQTRVKLQLLVLAQQTVRRLKVEVMV